MRNLFRWYEEVGLSAIEEIACLIFFAGFFFLMLFGIAALGEL
nr:hypothetical protein 37 [bacterium]